jgi:hypothetical protein
VSQNLVAVFTESGFTTTRAANGQVLVRSPEVVPKRLVVAVAPAWSRSVWLPSPALYRPIFIEYLALPATVS